jgi:hypothetical protein
MTMSTRGDTAAMLCALHQYLTHQDIKDQTDSATTQIPAQGGYPQQGMAPQSGGGYPQQGMAPQSGGGYPQQGMMPQGYGVQPQQFTGDTDQYQGRVQAQQQNGYQQQQQAQGYPPQGQYMQGQQGMMPPGYPQNGGVQGGYPQQTAMMPSNNGWQQPMQGQSGSNLSQSPWQTGSGTSQMLQGSVTTVAKGTKFEAKLRTSLDSATAEPGEIIEATISTPIYSNGTEVIPAGSKLIGQVTDVVSAKRFKFGANGKIELKFTQVQTPDGRKFPLTASVDKKRVKLQGGSTAGRVGKGLMWTGIGAGGGALLGTAFGAMAQNPYALATGHPVMRSAMIGGTLGGTAGLVGAAVRKGSEVKIGPGTELPIQLDEELQVSGGGQPSYQ